jgi:hypothetical protein
MIINIPLPQIPAGHVELTLADLPPVDSSVVTLAFSSLCLPQRGASKPKKKSTNSKVSGCLRLHDQYFKPRDQADQERGAFATEGHPQHEDPRK